MQGVRPADPGIYRLFLADAYWSLTLYPQAGEAGGCFVPSRRRSYTGVRGCAADQERARSEAARRARGKVRRYCASNGLNRLGTLTYGPPFCTDPDVLRQDVALFFRNLRSALGGRPLPYLWVPELHADGERFHVHFAVGQYIPRSMIDAAWGHGFIHIKSLSDLPVGSGALAEARLAARYLSKYVSKTFDTDLSGRHRYECAQGFGPQATALRGRTAAEVFARACELMGAQPEHVWNSDEVEDWRGAPAMWLTWR